MLVAKSYSWINEIGYYYRTNYSGLTATKRSDPTNVLKILLNLNDLVVSRNVQLKKSFDNYVVDMIVGTLAKYADTTDKQKEVFDFAHTVVVPSLGLNTTKPDYLFTQLVDTFEFVRAGEYESYREFINTPRRKLRAKLRKIYDTAQVILARFTV